LYNATFYDTKNSGKTQQYFNTIHEQTNYILQGCQLKIITIHFQPYIHDDPKEVKIHMLHYITCMYAPLFFCATLYC